ncbi:MAG: hypothetical protein PHP35_02690 [Candidatus Colwellbacteria bacterium]|nr:hypothetical protein [Candidatus Colwellbacteria bacterium]
MLIGRDYELSILENLRKKGKLSGCFLFFGPEGIGKFSSAKIAAQCAESGTAIRNNDDSSDLKNILTECLIVSPDEKGTIGIDAVRRVKYFLSLRPTNSPVRCVILNKADKLTDAAANASLKIVEEPPEDSLIILVAANPDNLPSPLVSRLKKIYFPPVPENIIADWLINLKKADKPTATAISSRSFGSPEFASILISAASKKKKAKVDFKFNSDEEYNLFVKESMVSLYNDERRDSGRLAEFCRRVAAIGQSNTNKKLQLQTIKWTP